MEQTQIVIAIIVVVLLLVGGYWYVNKQAIERMKGIYLDQMAMKSSDPMYFKYSSWDRDITGMSPRDYYLENQTNYINKVAPGYFEGDGLYVDQTDYLGMPPDARPLHNKNTDSLEEAQMFDSELAPSYYKTRTDLREKAVYLPPIPSTNSGHYYYPPGVMGDEAKIVDVPSPKDDGVVPVSEHLQNKKMLKANASKTNKPVNASKAQITSSVRS
jgi:hypothetical protein